ncbi:MAG: hypothetical protein ACI3YB_02410 [Prevotella sp.]
MGKNTRISVSLMLLTLFLVFKTGITMFTHIHIVDGVVVVHSHPYSDEHHTHSVEQIISIAQIATVQAMEPVNVCDIAVKWHTAHHYEYHVPAIHAQTLSVCFPSLRAPPVCC